MTTDVQDSRGQKYGRRDSSTALALQSSPRDRKARQLGLNPYCKDHELHSAGNRKCHKARQQVVSVMDARIQNLTTTHRLNE